MLWLLLLLVLLLLLFFVVVADVSFATDVVVVIVAFDVAFVLTSTSDVTFVDALTVAGDI